MRSNCIIIAVIAVSRASQRGRSPLGAEVHLWARWSRNAWGWFHMGWQKTDPETGRVAWRRSFKPLKPVDVPWWQAWRRWKFEGRVVRDDKWTPVKHG